MFDRGPDPWIRPALVGGAYWEVSARHVGVRVRYEHDVTFLAEPFPSFRDDEILGLELALWP